MLTGLALVAALALAFHAGRFSLAHDKAAVPHAAIETAGPASEPGTSPASPPGSYRAQVLRVIDGDTVEARVFVWPGHEIITKIRLRGIDAPELKGACEPEIKQAEAARDRLAELIGQDKVTLAEIGPDKYYGRVVARLLTAGAGQPVDAGAVLVTEKLARPYGGKRRESWCVLAGG